MSALVCAAFVQRFNLCKARNTRVVRVGRFTTSGRTLATTDGFYLNNGKVVVTILLPAALDVSSVRNMSRYADEVAMRSRWPWRRQ